MKNIVITGAGKGIGRATALRLATNNKVLAFSRDEHDLIEDIKVSAIEEMNE